MFWAFLKLPSARKKNITIIHRWMLIDFFYSRLLFFILHLVRHINNCLFDFLPLVFVFLFYLCRCVLYMDMYTFSACMWTCVCAHVGAYAHICFWYQKLSSMALPLYLFRQALFKGNFQELANVARLANLFLLGTFYLCILRL